MLVAQISGGSWLVSSEHATGTSELFKWIYWDMDNTVARRTPVSLRRFEQQTLLFAASTTVVVNALLAWYAIYVNITEIYWLAGLLIAAGFGVTLPFCWKQYKTERKSKPVIPA